MQVGVREWPGTRMEGVEFGKAGELRARFEVHSKVRIASRFVFSLFPREELCVIIYRTHGIGGPRKPQTSAIKITLFNNPSAEAQWGAAIDNAMT